MDNRSSAPKPLYIDENITIHEGEDAAALLRSQTARQAVDPERGLAQVDRARWEEAQRYERRTWMENARRFASDRNEYHRERFANYAVLQGRHFQRGIELGCGPFTNLRLILEHCRIQHVHLLDPLLSAYLTHPFCKYRRGRFGGLLNENLMRLFSYLRRPGQVWRFKQNDYRVGGWSGRPAALHPTMIESFQTDQRFDLVVMINVLEHCQDALAVLAKIDEILLPGGLLVYHDKLYHAQEVQALLQRLYDAGHPLRVDRSVVDEFLNRRFRSWMRAEYWVETEFRGAPLSYAELYYIGQKQPPAV